MLIQDLNQRSRTIFRQIVDTYILTGEPVGSRTLSQKLKTPLSPASIRNVMADLEVSGLVFSPHKSAGRIPTDMGLRLFVDGMLEMGNLTSEEYYEDLQNANLMSVIDTRKGLPVALSILYMHTARTQGWQIEGLSFPGHFLIRLYGADRTGGDPVIIDPFHDGKILDARDLRNMIHEFTGDEAKLSPGYYEAVTDREILVRLLNNIKIRCLQVSDLGQAIEILTRLVMIDPAFMQHHYELGMLLAYVGKNGPARERLLYCLDQLNKLERNDLITQQIINTLKNMDAVDLEKQGSNIVKLPKID